MYADDSSTSLDQMAVTGANDDDLAVSPDKMPKLEQNDYAYDSSISLDEMAETGANDKYNSVTVTETVTASP